MLQQLRTTAAGMRGVDWRRAPARVWQGVPSVLLAVMLNTLDATSTGLLVFPPASVSPAFAALQAPAMSIYVMSTMISQLTLTLGGSGFPGALGSMLVEVLPFLRALAADIQGVLGKDNPKLVPTVVTAYALTSFLIGFCFLGLGLLRLGWMVEYIPSTVLQGTIGALGLSLFLLGFQLTIPPGAPELTLSTAGELFTGGHIAVLLACVLPTLVLCISLRSKFIARITRGFTQHAMYVPCFMLSIVTIFWVVVTALGQANEAGMKGLSAKGWLFTVNGATSHESGLGTAWNYFKLFNFRMVEWSAMKAGIGNIVLLVIIGALNLPIYVPAMGLILKQPNIRMNRELVGHGISNILSGCVGSVPNLIVLSNSRLFTFAGGGRAEGFATAILSLATFFCSGRLLPYVPTVVAAVLVCFLGMDLMIESLWAPASELVWSEWLIAVGTMVACTEIGFLQGFAIGFGGAIFQYCLWNFYDMRASRIKIALNSNEQTAWQEKALRAQMSFPVASDETIIEKESSDSASDRMSVSTLASGIAPSAVSEVRSTTAEVVSVYGHVFFGIIPSLEQRVAAALRSSPTTQVIIDFSNAWRCETCIGQMFRQKLDEYRSDVRPQPLIFTGIPADSALALDLGRGGVSCVWPQMGPTTSIAFDDAVDCYFDLYDGISASQGGNYSDRWLGRPFLDPTIGDLLRSQNATIHELKPNETLDLQDPSMLLALQGTVRVSTSYSPLGAKGVRGLSEKEHLARLPLTIALKMCLLKMVMACRRVFKAPRDAPRRRPACVFDEEKTVEQVVSLRGGVNILRSGDTYWPDTESIYRSEKQCAERLTAMEEGCRVLALPIDSPSVDSEVTRQLLQSLETQSMYRRTLSRAVWKF